MAIGHRTYVPLPRPARFLRLGPGLGPMAHDAGPTSCGLVPCRTALSDALGPVLCRPVPCPMALSWAPIHPNPHEIVRGKAKWQTDHGKRDGIARRTISDQQASMLMHMLGPGSNNCPGIPPDCTQF